MQKQREISFHSPSSQQTVKTSPPRFFVNRDRTRCIWQSQPAHKTETRGTRKRPNTQRRNITSYPALVRRLRSRLALIPTWPETQACTRSRSTAFGDHVRSFRSCCSSILGLFASPQRCCTRERQRRKNQVNCCSRRESARARTREEEEEKEEMCANSIHRSSRLLRDTKTCTSPHSRRRRFSQHLVRVQNSPFDGHEHLGR